MSEPSPASALPLEINVQETRQALTERAGGIRLIDVREPDEHAYNRLPGAELIPLATLPSVAASRLADRNAEIIIYCHHGMRSAHATNQLRQLGYTNVRSMAGGIDGWSREIDPEVPVY